MKNKLKEIKKDRTKELINLSLMKKSKEVIKNCI